MDYYFNRARKMQNLPKPDSLSISMSLTLFFFFLLFPCLVIILQLENNQAAKGYAEAIIDADEIALAASPSGTAHAIVNVDPIRTTFLLGCQDSIVNYNNSTTDFNVWNDL